MDSNDVINYPTGSIIYKKSGGSNISIFFTVLIFFLIIIAIIIIVLGYTRPGIVQNGELNEKCGDGSTCGIKYFCQDGLCKGLPGAPCKNNTDCSTTQTAGCNAGFCQTINVDPTPVDNFSFLNSNIESGTVMVAELNGVELYGFPNVNMIDATIYKDSEGNSYNLILTDNGTIIRDRNSSLNISFVESNIKLDSIVSVNENVFGTSGGSLYRLNNNIKDNTYTWILVKEGGNNIVAIDMSEGDDMLIVIRDEMNVRTENVFLTTGENNINLVRKTAIQNNLIRVYGNNSNQFINLLEDRTDGNGNVKAVTSNGEIVSFSSNNVDRIRISSNNTITCNNGSVFIEDDIFVIKLNS